MTGLFATKVQLAAIDDTIADIAQGVAELFRRADRAKIFLRASRPPRVPALRVLRGGSARRQLDVAIEY